jgi:hypothetical protein
MDAPPEYDAIESFQQTLIIELPSFLIFTFPFFFPLSIVIGSPTPAMPFSLAISSIKIRSSPPSSRSRSRLFALGWLTDGASSAIVTGEEVEDVEVALDDRS